jgi:hypothetical protein
MKLVDFSELVAKGNQDKEKFWDWVDSELKDLRILHKDKAEPEQKNAISLWVSVQMCCLGGANRCNHRVFACTLREHQRLCPTSTSGKKKSATARQLPSWQVDIGLAVQEMESYTQDDLAAEKEPEDDTDEMDPVDEDEEYHSHCSGSVE